MRLDKFFSELGILSRKETQAAARAGMITVNGNVVKDPARHVDPDADAVTLRGERVCYRKFTYVMLNKPAGYISATEDGNLPVVTSLLPEQLQRMGLFPCGRLDRDTVGLMILMNDGVLSHRLLSPRHHAKKVYFFRCEARLDESDVSAFREGMKLDGEPLKSAVLSPDKGGLSGTVTLTEGKYHQIKRMFLQRGNKITYLKRVSFGGLSLDPTLAEGEWRYLSDDEIAILTANE
ncbi:MAG: rRNA pseudouridine synthase [Clostridia bacterium]|nr:rRNA pseudouridine synthase [Clostridia bacterium]